MYKALHKTENSEENKAQVNIKKIDWLIRQRHSKVSDVKKKLKTKKSLWKLQNRFFTLIN